MSDNDPKRTLFRVQVVGEELGGPVSALWICGPGRSGSSSNDTTSLALDRSLQTIGRQPKAEAQGRPLIAATMLELV
jgi:hypothetical protein